MGQSPLSSNALSICHQDIDAREPALARVLILLLHAYRLLLRPLLPASCRFAPTCSVFAEEAIRRHGTARGIGLALRRLGRCHPWHAGGFDPVPPSLEG